MIKIEEISPAAFALLPAALNNAHEAIMTPNATTGTITSHGVRATFAYAASELSVTVTHHPLFQLGSHAEAALAENIGKAIAPSEAPIPAAQK